MNQLFVYFAAAMLCGCSFSENNTRNSESEAYSSSSNMPNCITLADVNNTLSPLDLFAASIKCANTNKIQDAARLFLFARVYGTYDILRVRDNSSSRRRIYTLVQNSFSQMGKNAQVVSKEINTDLIGNKGNFKIFCETVKAIGKPSYYPDYLINHGISDFAGTASDNALVNNFDEEKAWIDAMSYCK